MSTVKRLLLKPGYLENRSKILTWVNDLFRPVNRFLRRVKRLLEFVPVVWNSYDWDHSYATGLFCYQLQRMVNYLEKNQTHVGWENDVSRMKTAIELIKRVDDSYYSLEYFDILEKRYGKNYLDFGPTDSPDAFDLTVKYEKDYTEDQLLAIRQDELHLLEQSRLKQEKAKRILWKFIDHNIENWWS